MDTVAKRLKFLRERILGDISQADLAAELRKLGVKDSSYNAVWRYENGEAEPRADYVAAMAELTGYSADWIVSGANGEHPPGPTRAERALSMIEEIVAEAREPAADDVAAREREARILRHLRSLREQPSRAE